MRLRAALAATALLLALAGCSGAQPPAGRGGGSTSATGPAAGSEPRSSAGGAGARPFVVRDVAALGAPWAMTFLPDGRALVTEKAGALRLVDPATGRTQEVRGAPAVEDAGQGGLGDVVVGPRHASDRVVYLSWVEDAGGGTSRAVVGRATLALDGEPRLEGLTPIWRQDPATGDGHFSHRLAVSPDGRHLYVSSGERQRFTPAQDLGTNLGKILRLDLDGAAADGNPFADRGGVSAQIWTLGHRNPLGLAFDPAGRLWSSEMGPRGGDEVNLVERGRNYGWPEASNGDHYDGRDIPDHTGSDGFAAPRTWWNPSVSPGSLMIYTGTAFPAWRGDAFVGALSGEALVRVDLDGTAATKAEQFELGARIREVEQGPDGSIWLLEDGPGGRLRQLTPSG